MHYNVISYSSNDLIDGYQPNSGRLLVVLGTGLVFWLSILGFACWIAFPSAFAAETVQGTNDPMVMKVYPDGTKVMLRWSEVGKSIDNGDAHGGAPKIVAYNPSTDGIVPIGEPSPKSSLAPFSKTNSNSVISPAQPSMMNGESASPKGEPENLGPSEGFGFRTDVGVAFQQSLSGRESSDYYTATFQPGIRFDIEPHYNITSWFAVGVEAGFIHNTVHSISVNDTTLYAGSSDFGNGDLYQVPILLNTRFQFPSDGPLRGFVGGGVGGSWDFLNLGIGGESSQTSYQWNYSFELSTGLCYTISPGFDLNASFKTLCTPNPLGEAQNGQQKALYNYAAEIGVAWRF